MEHEELTEKIIGAAIAVHRSLGPGFLESVYENALVIEFAERGLSCERQVDLPVFYQEREVGRHRLDLLIEGTVIVELKAVRNLDSVFFAVLKSYLRAANLNLGLLVNFARTTLEVKRVFT